VDKVLGTHTRSDAGVAGCALAAARLRTGALGAGRLQTGEHGREAMGGRPVSRDRDVRGYPGVGGVVAAKDDGPQGADVGGDDRRGRRRRFPEAVIVWSSISTVISSAPR
jgi:hypothetical protein